MMIAQKAKKSKHFQYDTRLLLEHYLLGKGHFPKITDTKELAEIFRKSVRTIEREIRRGLVCHLKSDLTEVWEYNADFAQRAADYEKSAKGAPIKLSNNKQLLGQIAFLINEQNFSPYAVIEHLKREDFYGCTHFCEKSLYNYISEGLIDCVTVKNLPNKGVKFKEKETKPKFSRAECALRSIDNRPAEINDRSEVGHWEIDTVKSAKDTGNACLLTLTERKTRAEIAVKMNDGTAASVVSELDKIEDKIGRKNFTQLFKSITADGGSEFTDFAGIEKTRSGEKRTQLFFAHPYRSCERGTNENHNRMLRRFFPKGTDFSKVQPEQVAGVQAWMNGYYRKIHNGKTPLEMLQKEMGKDFALPL